MECQRNNGIKDNIHKEIIVSSKKHELTYKEILTAIVDSIYMVMDLPTPVCGCDKCLHIRELSSSIFNILKNLSKADAIRILEEVRLDYNAMMVIQSVLTKAPFIMGNKSKPDIYL